VLWRVVDEQMYVLAFAVHIDQLCLEAAADLLENGLEPLEASASNTFLRYFVTKTKWVCNTDTQCLP
jgi:hypothetical protein